MVWGVIGGSAALGLVAGFEAQAAPRSAYGSASSAVLRGQVGGCELVFLPRHGEPRHIAPHLINNRANVDVLCALNVHGVVALNTVGGISTHAKAGRIFVPDQIIDYTWGRDHTFSDHTRVIHTDFAQPLDEALRRSLIEAAGVAGVEVHGGGVYGCTQGPRFETAAEIDRMSRDGCDLVGMTAMPEAALARERGLPYAMLSLVVNPAAGRAADPFDMDTIARVAEQGMARVERLLLAFFQGEMSL